MSILTPAELETAIKKYKSSHPRVTKVNFEGEEQEYRIEQLGLDIIETLEAKIKELEGGGHNIKK
jgi:hypothetical protein